MPVFIKTDENGFFAGSVVPAIGTESHYQDDGYWLGEVPDDKGKQLVAGIWQLPLGVAKDRARSQITLARNAEERAGFLAYGKRFDSDETAIQRISVAAQAAQTIGESFTVNWTCKDNSTIVLDSSQMQALPVIMANAANTLHIKARDLKSLIESANTLEELALITW